MRGHYRAPVQGSGGALQAGAVISVYVNGTTTPPSGAGTLLPGPIYADGSSLATLSNPFTTLDGNVSFYLAAEQRVDLGIQPPGGQLVIFPDIDVNAASVSSAQLTFPGSGASSTAVGNNATATQPQAVALGDTASATGQQSTAAGQQAAASGTFATAYGQLATASGTGATALGQASSAGGPGAIAVGQNTGAAGTNATAVGSGAAATAAGSTALGTGAQAVNPNTVVLGTIAQNVVIPGGVDLAQTPAQALSNGSTISFTSTMFVPVTATGAVTGLILQATAPAPAPGQWIIINNESAFTLTFAASGTSNVADGTADVIAPTSARAYIFDANTLLWYPLTGTGSTVGGNLTVVGSFTTTGLGTVTGSGGLSAGIGSLDIPQAGAGLKVAEGTNAKQGTAVLNGGTPATVVVSNTSVTANSRIFITGQGLAGGTAAAAYSIAGKTPGTSFTIQSSVAADAATVAYQIFEPG